MNEEVYFTLIRGNLFFGFDRGKKEIFYEVKGENPEFMKVYKEELDKLNNQMFIKFEAEIDLEWDEDRLMSASIEDFELCSEWVDYNEQRCREWEDED